MLNEYITARWQSTPSNYVKMGLYDVEGLRISISSQSLFSKPSTAMLTCHGTSTKRPEGARLLNPMISWGGHRPKQIRGSESRCRERSWGGAGDSDQPMTCHGTSLRDYLNSKPSILNPINKKSPGRGDCCRCGPGCTGGGYLLSHFRSTIGVVRFNFSVRNGKRWSPHAIATLVSSPSSSLDGV